MRIYDVTKGPGENDPSDVRPGLLLSSSPAYPTQRLWVPQHPASHGYLLVADLGFATLLFDCKVHLVNAPGKDCDLNNQAAGNIIQDCDVGPGSSGAPLLDWFSNAAQEP